MRYSTDDMRNFAGDTSGHIGGVEVAMKEAADEIDRLRAALRPFAEPHFMGDNYVKFAPRLIEAARAALT